MASELGGKVIIVTGASAGIGQAVAVEAARCGMRVALAARRAEKLNDVATAIRAHGGEALTVLTDVSDAHQVQALVDQTVEHFGQLDVMLANAGFGHYAGVSHIDSELDRKMWDVNYFGTMHCCQAAAAVMKRQGGGHLMITSSILAHLGLPFYSTYSATKAAQHALAMSLRVELAGDGIDVTSIYPVGTKTEFFKTAAKLDGRDLIQRNTPAMFMQSPRYVARRIIAAMRRPRPEVWPSRLAHVGAALFVMFPGLRTLALRSKVEDYRRAAGESSDDH